MPARKVSKPEAPPYTMDDIARRFLSTPPDPRPAVEKKKPRKRAK